MKKMLLIFTGALLSLAVIAQPKNKQSVVIGKMTTKENALLILNPPNSDQGVLLPQLSTGQRISLKPTSPSEDGLTVFDTNAKSYFYWSDGKWIKVLSENAIKTSYYSIDPVDFQELKAIDMVRHNNVVVFETDNSFIAPSRNDAGEQMIASISLSHGSVMQELSLYYMDNDSNDLQVKLLRKNLSGNNEEIISWKSSGTSPQVRQQSFTSFTGKEVIDLEHYSYRLLVVFDVRDIDVVIDPTQARQRIYGARIKYQQ